MDHQRALAWDFGVLSVDRRGAMLGPVVFVLPDGRQVAPLHVAPWFAEPIARTLTGLMPRLRGEWPCIPFGFDADRPSIEAWPASRAAAALDEGHGFGANHDWTFAERSADEMSLSINYPEPHPIARLDRRIAPDSHHPAIDIDLTVLPRRDCLLPIGLHPTFGLPPVTGSFEIVLGAETDIATYPGDVDATSAFAPARYAPIAAVPLRVGGTLDIRRVPLAIDTEEVVQVLDGAGAITLRNHAERYQVRLSWERRDFSSLLLWFSNRGRRSDPWLGRHLALGVEPICSAFDLGTALSAGPNPLSRRGVPTARAFVAGEAWTTRYRIAVESLDA